MTTQTVFDQALEALAILRVNRTVQLSHSAEAKVAACISALLAAKQASGDAYPSPVSVQLSDEQSVADLEKAFSDLCERNEWKQQGDYLLSQMRSSFMYGNEDGRAISSQFYLAARKVCLAAHALANACLVADKKEELGSDVDGSLLDQMAQALADFEDAEHASPAPDVRPECDAKFEILRHTLEIIAVGDSTDPKKTAEFALIEIGHWTSVAPDVRPSVPSDEQKTVPVNMPKETGVYVWHGGSSASLVMVNKRPSVHSPGGVLKGHVMDSSKFYDGCPVEQWTGGRWLGPLTNDVAPAVQEAPFDQPELDCIEYDPSGKLVSADVIVGGERVKMVREAAPSAQLPNGWRQYVARAYVTWREHDHTTPDDVLDLMRDILYSVAPAPSADPLQALADAAQDLDIGYGPNACPTCGKSVPAVSADATLHRIADVFGIGSEARTPDTILANVENAARRSKCLRAIEREFFTVTAQDDDGEEYDECPLNWGADPAEYVEQFRAAIAAQSKEGGAT